MLTIRLPSDLTGNEEADKVWGLQTRPCAWHLNSARLGYLASGLQEVGPELGLNSSPSLLSLSTKRIYNNHHDGTILIPLQLIFLLICDMTRNSHWFVLQFRSSMAKSLEMNPTEPALQNSVDRQDCICLSKMKTWQQLWDEILATS